MRISDWSSDVCSSDLLKSSLRQGDILGRLGGNEFGIFARLNNGLSDALQIVQRINGALAAPCRLSDLQISVACALGCALSGHEEEELEDVLRQAQAAMKLAMGRAAVRGSVGTDV